MHFIIDSDDADPPDGSLLDWVRASLADLTALGYRSAALRTGAAF